MKKIVVVTAFKKKVLAFPKGKVEENETGSECAIREIKEEIGYDISGLIDPHQFIEIEY